MVDRKELYASIVIEGGGRNRISDNKVINPHGPGIEIRDQVDSIIDGNSVIFSSTEALEYIRTLNPAFSEITVSHIDEARSKADGANDKEQAFRDTFLGRVASGAAGGGLVQVVMAAIGL
ncbi:parallel beta-helix repeat (two copies) [Cognatiyoonia koreensis]|uniref:Parallel beta-helix repeat (Two copies) n=1 Tax=Cognatiyoonia koreensis TaxID=364200 RepID=A0A1I0PJC2_9RHOB|nr:right-handed parallel beta-helix repeat-containing protein [Cognatiyoonia koreensis]SEW14472.1 parallel beta-helix repeat (two copies) [Cognatiyoonia koreensis]